MSDTSSQHVHSLDGALAAVDGPAAAGMPLKTKSEGAAVAAGSNAGPVVIDGF